MHICEWCEKSFNHNDVIYESDNYFMHNGCFPDWSQEHFVDVIYNYEDFLDGMKRLEEKYGETK